MRGASRCVLHSLETGLEHQRLLQEGFWGKFCATTPRAFRRSKPCANYPEFAAFPYEFEPSTHAAETPFQHAGFGQRFLQHNHPLAQHTRPPHPAPTHALVPPTQPPTQPRASAAAHLPPLPTRLSHPQPPDTRSPQAPPARSAAAPRAVAKPAAAPARQASAKPVQRQASPAPARGLRTPPASSSKSAPPAAPLGINPRVLPLPSPPRTGLADFFVLKWPFFFRGEGVGFIVVEAWPNLPSARHLPHSCLSQQYPFTGL